MHENAIELVQAGFSPTGLLTLAEKLKCIIKNGIATTVDEFHVPLPENQAFEALVIPGLCISFFMQIEIFTAATRSAGQFGAGRDLLQVFLSVEDRGQPIISCCHWRRCGELNL